jgi:FkbM family methyltransferase
VIVIDVGCARYGGDYSIERLIDEFQPHRLIGYDPHPSTADLLDQFDRDVPVTIYEAAAWTYDGMIGYVPDGLNSWVTDRADAEQVPCIDLARVIHELDDQIILKIDAEGAEYKLLNHLHVQRADEKLELAWVEWHGDPPDRERVRLERILRCPVEEWRW